MSKKRALEPPSITEHELQAAHDMLLEGQFRLLDAGPIISDVRIALDRATLWSDLMADEVIDSKLNNDWSGYSRRLWKEASERVKKESDLIGEAVKIRQKLYDIEFKRFENAAKIHNILQPVVIEQWNNRVPVKKRLLRSVSTSHCLWMHESPLSKDTWDEFVKSVKHKMFRDEDATVEWAASEGMAAEYAARKKDLDDLAQGLEDRLQKAITDAKI